MYYHAPLQDAIAAVIQSLPLCTQSPGVSKQRIEEFAFHVLNESCTTVTNTAAKSAVQLVFGKANLVSIQFIKHNQEILRNTLNTVL